MYLLTIKSDTYNFQFFQEKHKIFAVIKSTFYEKLSYKMHDFFKIKKVISLLIKKIYFFNA